MEESYKSHYSPIKKVNLSQQLVDYFIQNIESGYFAIGERVPNEIGLAEQLSVSRNILRESMKILENFGILHTVNGKGTMIAPNATANIQSMRFFEKLRNDTTALQLLEARMILEPRITYYACERCTQEDILHLQAIVSEPFNPKVPVNNADDYDFHIALARICGNDTLTDFLYTLIYHLRQGSYSEFNFHVEGMLREKSQHEHEDILAAFIRQDPASASLTMECHLQDRINIIRSLYRPELDSQSLKKDTLIKAMNLPPESES